MNLRQLFTASCMMLAALDCLRAQTPSTNDVWDVRHGVTILAHSPLDVAFGDPLSYDAANIFGAANGTFFEGQLGRVVFTDGEPPGFVHFVEWRTVSPVVIRSFRLFASGESGGLREFAEFRLLAKTNNSTTFNHMLYTFTPSHPYTYVDPTNELLLASDVQPTTAQEFRAEFVNLASSPTYYNGPRILELDGFSEPIHVRAEIRFSEVEVCWDSSLGINYQVEYRDGPNGGDWEALGSPVAGNGGKQCVTDPIAPGSPSRYYRIRTLE